MGLGSPEGPACQRTARQCGRAHASPMPDDQGSSETAATSPFLYHWLQAPFFFAPLMSITYAQLNNTASRTAGVLVVSQANEGCSPNLPAGLADQGGSRAWELSAKLSRPPRVSL